MSILLNAVISIFCLDWLFFNFDDCIICFVWFFLLFIYIKVLFLLAAFIVLLVLLNLFCLYYLGLWSLFCVEMFRVSTIFRFDPIVLFVSCYCWSRIFDFFCWWFFAFLFLGFFCFDCFQNVIELLIYRFVFWMKSSMFLNEIFADLEFLMNVCGD